MSELAPKRVGSPSHTQPVGFDGKEAKERTAEQMARLLGGRQPMAPWTLPCATRLTQKWIRGGFDGYAPGMDGHLIAGYYGAGQRCSWTLENRRLASVLRPSTITLIPALHDGHWTLEGNLEVSHVYLSNRRLQICAESFERTRPLPLLDRLGFEDAAVARVLELLSSEATTQSAPTLFLDEMLDLLCLQLTRRHSELPNSQPRVPRQGLTPNQVRLLTNYMREHLHRNITLDELAGLVRLSGFYFCRSFRLATGKRPHEWLTMERMERARTLLRNRSLQITDISVMVGYQTPSAFASAFRKAIGETPSNYRRML